MNTLKKLWKDERGLETIEYAVIAALIVVGVMVTLGNIGEKIQGIFEGIEAEL